MPDPYRVNRKPRRSAPTTAAWQSFAQASRIHYPVSTFWQLWKHEGELGGFYIRHAAWPITRRFLVVSMLPTADGEPVVMGHYYDENDLEFGPSWAGALDVTDDLDDRGWSHRGQAKAKREGRWVQHLPGREPRPHEAAAPAPASGVPQAPSEPPASVCPKSPTAC